MGSIISDLIIHVPHASTHIPADLMDQFLLDPKALDAEVQASADLYTDLLAQQAWPNATIVAAKVSRVVFDVERYDDDERESMAAVGRGMIYSATHDGLPLRRAISSQERSALQASFYDPHWAQLTAMSAGKTLIDLHSYPVTPWRIEPDPFAHRPEIDLGTLPGITPRSWVDAVHRHFEDAGYSVAENTPYAEVIAADAKRAMMIEIRRDVVGEPSDSAAWQRLVSALSGMPL